MTLLYDLLLRLPRYALSAIALITLLMLTLLPSDSLPDGPEIPGLDKVVHFLMFGLVSCALLVDASRRRGQLTYAMIFIVGLGVTLLGILIELLQQSMGFGRSGELLDIVADATGAFLLPVASLHLLRKFANRSRCRLVTHMSSDIPFCFILPLYLDAFPEEERRSADDLRDKLLDPTHPLSLHLILHQGRPAGFITSWDFGSFRYIEHFVVDPRQRGHGIGETAIRQFIAESPSIPVVLEAEPTTLSPVAARRIAFYTRCGFTAHPEFPYIQPPYSPGLPSVPLTLLTTHPSPDLPGITTTLHSRVYNV